MSEARQCPNCDTELPADAPEGLCPQCLLAAGLDGSTIDETTPGDSPNTDLSDTPTLPPRDRDEATAASPAIGETVKYFGDYELLDEIARGGMGVVYQARQTKLNRIVAVKMILAGQLASDEDVQRFHVEAEAAANLQHPNIVAIHEVGEHNGQHYFSMEFVEGTTLAEMVRASPLSPRRAAEYVKKIAEAVHYAHNQGTLHRDLKPSNILVDTSDEPRITDFGLARKIEGDSRLTVSGAAVGTPSYMPPEQAASKRSLIGPASDVYSLGAVLYELLTGRPPFQAASPTETLIQVLEQDPVSPRILNSTIPLDLATICMKCLEKRPESRYLSADELAEDLGRFLNQEPIVARPAGSGRKLWSWSKRHPWAFTAAATLLVAGLLGLAYYMWVENSFLRGIAGNPDYLNLSNLGRRLGQQKLVMSLASIVLVGQSVALLLSSAHATKLKREGRSISPRRLVALAFLGITGIGFGIFVGMKSIEFLAWKIHGPFGWNFLGVVVECLNFFIVFAVWYITGLVLLLVVQEYESTTFGTVKKPTDPDEMREAIRSLFLRKDSVARRSYWHRSIRQRAISHHLISTLYESELSDSIAAVDAIQNQLHQELPDEVPAVPEPSRTAVLTGLLVFYGAVLLLVSIAGIGLSVQAPAAIRLFLGLAGIAAFAGAAFTYVRNCREFTLLQFHAVVCLVAVCGFLAGMFGTGVYLGSAAFVFGGLMAIISAKVVLGLL